ncbi:MAG: hypothetical protein JXR62_03125 [Bacilli bacterium]|nr:hypothetical protein [Bacilli bacterium]
MKIIRNLVILLVVIVVLGAIGLTYIQAEVDEDSLPTSVYNTDTSLTTLIYLNLFDLFITSSSDEYSVIEETINLVILDSIHENINAEYDPLSDCETMECNFIIHDDYYYVSYLWAELTEDNQLMVHVSIGSDKIINVNTILTMYFDIDVDYTGFEISFTLDKYDINNHNISITVLDRIFGYFDKDQIEDSVTNGELNLDDYSYTISFSPLP